MRDHLAGILLFITFAVLSGGCGDDDCATAPHPGQEKIAGQVLGGNGPVINAWVRIVSMDAQTNGYHLETSIQTDSEGRFDLAVPPGNYGVSILGISSVSTFWYSASGPQLKRANADTIRIVDEGDSAVVNFVFGGFELHSSLASGFAGNKVNISVTDSSFTQSYARRSVGFLDNAFYAQFPVLPPGKCQLQLEIASRDYSWQSSFWLPPTLDRRLAEPFEILPSEMTSWENPLPEPCTLQGILSGPWADSDFSRPYVDVIGPDSIWVGRSSVNERGEYEIPLFASGWARIKVSVGETDYWIGQEDYPGGYEFEIVPGTTIFLDPLWVGGFACNLNADPAWENLSAAIEVYDQNGAHITTVNLAKDNIIGIPLFSAGTYKFNVVWSKYSYHSCPWRPQWFDRATSFEEATPIVLSAGIELEEVDIFLERGGSISGHVYTPGGNPVNGRYLVAKSPDGEWAWSHRWRSTESGVYRIEGLPDGEFIIGAQHSNAGDNQGVTWYPGTNDDAHASPITIVDAQEVSGIDIWLIP
ncbi:MAG: hypothetical protein KJ970_20350 [Candidatus Eisenbacteria bacterium]|uniref:Carboxypeptidase regulatory-like domain-containing protein n=1 Tax=Eiseniibacteriota bacterium TaxID=2212470 RepID=A0A948RZJ3_UNCEI|nr:hypothetical protein [Candidatus Eisenbacteria bacterium]MBU1948597.1 hypothetical protein [Candidatus Eisenbacteria bacterium]MBU2693276.1 hypothetical protein [Candidatus Eisenbacteria bacterium]